MSVRIEVSDRKVPVALFPRRQTADQQAAFAFDRNEAAGTISQSMSESLTTTGYLLKNTATKYAVGYVDSEGRLKIFQADMYSMDPASNKRKSPEPSAEDGSEVQDAKTFFESRQELIQAYAPAKKQRQVRQALNAQVKDERIEGKTGAIDGLKKDLNKKTSEQEQVETGMLAMMRESLPEFDLAATEVNKIYNFSAIFPDSLVATLSLEEDSAVGQTLQWLKEDCPVNAGEKYPAIEELLKLRVFNRLGSIFVASKHMKNKTFARLFVICGDNLENFCSPQIHNTFLNLFGRGKISNDMGDKLLCHLILFILKLTPDFAFSFGLLVDDLQTITHKDLQPVLEFVGCSVKNGAALNATLTAPLKVPQLFGNKRRR